MEKFAGGVCTNFWFVAEFASGDVDCLDAGEVMMGEGSINSLTESAGPLFLAFDFFVCCLLPGFPNGDSNAFFISSVFGPKKFARDSPLS